MRTSLIDAIGIARTDEAADTDAETVTKPTALEGRSARQAEATPCAAFEPAK